MRYEYPNVCNDDEKNILNENEGKNAPSNLFLGKRPESLLFLGQSHANLL
jgi:hypothetical protein